MSEAEEAVETAADMAILRAENAALHERIKHAEDDTRERVMQAEMKAEALRSGMIDLDGLKLIPPDAILCDDKGAPIGLASVMAQLRRDKPWLFIAASSSSLAQPPPSASVRQKLATDMTLEEWRIARAELLRRR